MLDPVWVVPAFDREHSHRALEGLCSEVAARTVVVENGLGALPLDTSRYLEVHRFDGINRGVARSWNLGRAAALERAAGFLVLLSEAVELPQGGAGFLDELRSYEYADLVSSQVGWKLVGIGRQALERVGRFDENLWPAYYEDTDYLYRMHLAGLASPRENSRPGAVWVDTGESVPAGDAHTLRSGRVSVDFGRLAAYYGRKWGGQQGHEVHTSPFGREGADLSWWPAPVRGRA